MKHRIDALEALIPERDRAEPSVSGWTVGMQIHHALKSTERISRTLVESEPGAAVPKPNLARMFVLLTGRIPRGRGQAPKVSYPPPQPTEESLRELAQSARDAYRAATKTDPAAWWQHAIFGVLQRDKALRFIQIHNRHHLEIVRDILRRSPGPADP